MEVSSLPRPSGGIQPRSPRLLATFGDERLLEQLRRGNETAFEVIYDRHHRGILSFCRHMLRSREEAEDAVQQTFISAHGDLVGSDKEIRLKPWLYTIARNRCLSILRSRREQTAELEDVPTAGFSDEVARRDDLRRLLADMRDLPEDQRAALVLSELGDLSHAEIARVVDCDPMKVKSLVFQARSSLIESRDARDIPCEEIREQLATLTGGALRRRPLRRHLRACPACAEFRESVRRQRQMVACLLPVVPTVGLKHGVLAAVGLGPGAAAGAGAAAAGSGGGVAVGGLGASTGGGIVSSIGASGAAKLGIAAVIATGAVGGGVAIQRAGDSGAGQAAAPVGAREVAKAGVPSVGARGHSRALSVGSTGASHSRAHGAAARRSHAHAARGGHKARGAGPTGRPHAKSRTVHHRRQTTPDGALRRHHASTAPGAAHSHGHPGPPVHPAHPRHPVHPPVVVPQHGADDAHHRGRFRLVP